MKKNENCLFSVKTFLLITFIALAHTRNSHVDDDGIALRSHYHDMPKLIQQPAGSEVRLRCGIRGNHAEHMSTSDVNWHFKPCGEGFNRTSCRSNQDFESNQWRKIECDGRPCRVTFLIKSPTENDSGLYRCSIHPYKPDNHTTLEIKVVRTFQLDVINATVSPPELLDNLPGNTSAILDSQVVLQCRVFSKVPPSIKWFRKQDNSVHLPLEAEAINSKSIQYFENTYDLMESAGDKGLSEDTYLSKLIINNVSERDAGTYVCIGINYRGYMLREAFLKIIIPEESLKESGTGIIDLLILFLMPIGLAIIPLFVWTCFIIVKKRNKVIKDNSKLPSEHLYEKVDNI